MESQMHGTNEDVLVIEDSPTQAAHLASILETHGYRVAIASCGREALASLCGRKPDIIISDVMMPEMDGYELCSIIKSDPRLGDIPVILLTALDNPKDVIKGLECGADNFITKPYSEEHLLARIEQIRLNRDLSRGKESSAETEIFFAGRTYVIAADRRQILNLLLSTYEASIRKNNELVTARDELNRLNKKLEAANRELEAFNYTVSHDLRSPLTGISGYCQILTDICGEKLDEQCIGYVRMVEASASRMDQLITTILNFSRVGSIELHREPVDLSEISRVVAANLRMSDPRRQVSFSIAEGVVVNGDRRLLRIVMENLIGNAWKYTGTQEVASIEFGASDRDGGTVCFVQDNGTGFDMTRTDRLFAPFQRLHRKEDFEGHGIGLATVHRIIERHGGRIWAESAPGKGATFSFTLP